MKTHNKQRAHILLVEDNEGDVLLTKEAFEECNVKTEISVARNGLEALDFLHKKGTFASAKSPDLILLDINIPLFNGHEVLKAIKSDENLKKIPVIMLTTSTSQSDLKLAYESHCNSYVNKPLDIGGFLQAIQKIEQFWLHLTSLPNRQYE